MFHVVASTGRTATSFLAECFDTLPGIAACHEGHRRNDDQPALVPLVNLENQLLFKDPSAGARVVVAKRSAEIIAAARAESGCDVIVDGAYYNAMLGGPVLAAHPTSRMVAIVRDCESFVRSVTWIAGTDPMPVGWPDPAKPLDNRERFISMGRIRPTAGPDAEAWPGWGSIERNIWLWRATNTRLLDVKETWPDRVSLVDFAVVRSEGIVGLMRRILEGLHLDTDEVMAALDAAADQAASRSNERSGGYQIGERDTWNLEQQRLLHEAETDIESRIEKWM